jgi:hypothetical protein
MPTDPKWRTISKASGQRIGDVIAVYVHLLVTGSNATERGRTQSFVCEDVANALDMETEQVELIHRAMQGRVLDGDRLMGWSDRQPAREDGSAERAKAWREAKKTSEKGEANAGERNRTQTTEPERERTLDKDKDTEKKEREPRATRLASDWALPQDLREFCIAERPDLDPDFTAKRFADYWHGKPGKDGRKLDWPATWRNWVRGERTGPNAAPAGHTVPSRAADETARYLAERKEQEKQATLPPPALLAKVRGAVKTEAA